jgi:hypothetical protein
MDKLLFKRILVAALTILALVYVTYLLMSANFNMYPTENAVLTTITNSINTDGFIIRDETVLINKANSILSYSVANGEAVEANREIAKVFRNREDAAAYSKADALEKRIAALDDSQTSSMTGAVSVDVLNNSISGSFISFLDDINHYDVDAVEEDADRLLATINQRQLLTGKISNFDSQIASLNAQIEELRSSSGDSIGSVQTPKAGCFTEYCDGYENAFDYSKVDEMTLADLHSMKKTEVPQNAAGKIISNVKWYVACEITGDQANSLNTYDGALTVLFSDASSEPIPAELYRVQKDENGGNALVVLACDYMDSALLEGRQEPIEIGMGSYTGLRVSKRAIHDDYVTKTTYDDNDKPHREQKKVQGVYVLYGSEVQFKQIAITYATKDYVICDPSPAEGVLFNGQTIALYDKVIVKGDDLYDGKVIS